MTGRLQAIPFPDRTVPIETPPSQRYATASMRVAGAEPEALLRLPGAEPRGLWARGERWAAHRGVLVEVRFDETGPGSAIPDPFEELRRVAPDRASPLEAPDDEDPRRFYGGFAFRSDHRARGVWGAFPPVLFHLPALELTGGGDGAPRLRIRTPVAPGESDDQALSRAGEELEEVRRRLAGVRKTREGDAAGRGRAGGSTARLEESERDAWGAAVEDALAAIARGELDKAVLARILDVFPEGRVDTVEVALALWRQHAGAHAFLFEPRPGRSVVGAAPETVATLEDGRFNATAVAGSTRRGDDEEEEARLARELLASVKDRAEQRVVVEDMVARLRPLVAEVAVQAEPHVLTLARIQHLETEIRARVPRGGSRGSRGRHVLELLGALHPTPAVCGMPRDAALDFLAGAEPFERGWYAGPVGWFDPAGNGIFVPALRCGVAREGMWRLFAGAGIVAGSRPDDEWDETAIKFEPVLRALAASGVAVDRVPAGGITER